MTQDQAIAATKKLADEKGWTWLEPVEARLRKRWIFWGPRRWDILSNCRGRGCNVHVVIDDETGAVCEQAYLPR